MRTAYCCFMWFLLWCFGLGEGWMGDLQDWVEGHGKFVVFLVDVDYVV